MSRKRLTYQEITDRGPQETAWTHPVVLAAGALITLIVVANLAPGGVFGALILTAAYFAPTIVAVRRHHHQTGAIAVIDFFLGWTLIGWVVALAMSCSAVRP